MGLLEDWQLTQSELSEIIENRPSARGILFGFVAEYKLSKLPDASSGVSHVASRGWAGEDAPRRPWASREFAAASATRTSARARRAEGRSAMGVYRETRPSDVASNGRVVLQATAREARHPITAART